MAALLVVAIVPAMSPPLACRARLRLHAQTVSQAGSTLPEFPASPLPCEKIHPFYLPPYLRRRPPEFGRGDFAVGFFDRMQRRIIVVPLRELSIDPADHFAFDVLDDDGESHHVPFHRVRQVFKNGELIWHRNDE